MTLDAEQREWVLAAAARAGTLRKGLEDPMPYVEDHEYLETRGAHDLLLLADSCLALLAEAERYKRLADEYLVDITTAESKLAKVFAAFQNRHVLRALNLQAADAAVRADDECLAALKASLNALAAWDE